MIILKITLTISGKKLVPNTIIPYIGNSFLIIDQNSYDDQIFDNEEEGFGSISFCHPNKFSISGKIPFYEKEIVEFLIEHFNLFETNNTEEYELLSEIYYCNGNLISFEILSRDLLKKLTNKSICLALPVSVYKLDEKEFWKWYREIETQN